MITALSINNFALIEKLSIDFSKGFSIITGETGAGKSILLGALGLVLGKRADLSSLKNKEEKCIIEAHFDIANYQLQFFFEANDLDYADDTILRREILPSGKSRAFINDTPVTLQELQDLSGFLIDVHSQHQTQELSEDQFQFQIIDAVASNDVILSKYALELKRYKKDKSELEHLNKSLQSIIKEQDYNAFLLEELQAASIQMGDQLELESQFEQLNNVEFIKENLARAIVLADDEPYGVLHSLQEMRNSLQKLAPFSENYQTLFERIDSSYIEIKDAVQELQTLADGVLHDPDQLEMVQQKLQTLYALQKKHQVTSVEELIEIQKELEIKVDSLSELEAAIKNLEEQLQKSVTILNALADEIHNKRLKAIPVLIEKWTEILAQLGMPNVRFKIDLNPNSGYLLNGKDELQFLLSANKGTDFGLLKKVASGGELSRIMLATKAVLAKYSQLPTIIFDEIDTGVSGEIAHKMGEIMKAMSETMQVFAITHLPQIAAKGATHFKVFKSTLGENTSTELKVLSEEERVIEIAQMLSGTDVSESALNHAKALLN